MGHDIYACLERIHPSTGSWETLAEAITIQRQSTLFAVLAGVHTYHGMAVTPVSSPRGLPGDLSVGVQHALRYWEQGDQEDGDSDEAGAGTADTYYSYLSYKTRFKWT